MFKITATVRTAVRRVIADSNRYDAGSVQISRTGVVSARKDADKTFAGHDARRWVVGYVGDMVTQEGTIREGW